MAGHCDGYGPSLIFCFVAVVVAVVAAAAFVAVSRIICCVNSCDTVKVTAMNCGTGAACHILRPTEA